MVRVAISQSEKPNVCVADLGQAVESYHDYCCTTQLLVMGLAGDHSSAIRRAEGVGNSPVAAWHGTDLTMRAFRRSWHLRFFHLQSLVLFPFVSYEKHNPFLTNLLLYKPPTGLM